MTKFNERLNRALDELTALENAPAAVKADKLWRPSTTAIALGKYLGDELLAICNSSKGLKTTPGSALTTPPRLISPIKSESKILSHDHSLLITAVPSPLAPLHIRFTISNVHLNVEPLVKALNCDIRSIFDILGFASDTVASVSHLTIPEMYVCDLLFAQLFERSHDKSISLLNYINECNPQLDMNSLIIKALVPSAYLFFPEIILTYK